MMERYQIRRLPILNRTKRLVGMVSLGDLAVSRGNERRVGETLKQVSEPAEPRR
jgi:CBS domain-containing protein